MRIIAGKYRSRPLRTLRGLELRPTSDRLRETLFDVLTAGNPAALAETVWLDLYAGTGAVGIEALSRGARSVYFVESTPRGAALIRENLASLKVETESYEVLQREVNVALRRLDSQAVVCDYCFLDPPYRQHQDYETVLGFLSQSRLLNPGSVVIAEHASKFESPQRAGALERYRKLLQGDAGLSFYRVG